MYIIIFLLCCIIVSLCFYIYKQNKKNLFLFLNKSMIFYFIIMIFIFKNIEEGNLSILESDICKLVNKIYEQNHLLENEKLILKEYLEDISHQMKTPLTALNLIHEKIKESRRVMKKDNY